MVGNHGLFAKGDASETFGAHAKKAIAAVEQIPPNQFLNSTDEQLVEHVCSAQHIEPLTLYGDRATQDHEETKIDVSHDPRYGWPGERTLANATRVTISIPFTGDPGLWHLKPSTRYMRTFPGEIEQPGHDGIGTLRLPITQHADSEPNVFKQAYEDLLTMTKQMVANVNTDLARHTQQLPQQIMQVVQSRRKRLENQVTIRNVLNIPMTKRPGAPDPAPIVAQRKLVRPLPPAPSAKPEPTIRDEDYEHILGVIRHEGRSFETTPETFAKHGEEELRDIVMAHLNGHYQGSASGEKFRKKGKTDICIEDQSRAAFVAECKVWRGAKEVGEAIDQLLGYLTWRDCKCSLVFFNTRVAGFSGVQSALADSMKKHTAFMVEAGTKEPGEWRLRFKQQGDEQRIVTVHVFCFDLYVTPAKKKASGI